VKVSETGDKNGSGIVPLPYALQYDVLHINKISKRERLLEQRLELDNFLASVQKRAFRMAEIATGNREDAFDILQDAMCKFVEKYSKRNIEEWTPLFYTVLQSRIRDWYRRETVRNRFRVWFGSSSEERETDGMEKVADEQMCTPEQQLQNTRGIRALAQAVRQLPFRQQQAFMLRVFEGMDVAQTARVMGCTSGSVKTHYSRAIHTLREKLEGQWS
jgi:RNA polymerase sigma-70 factor (ECF subfamily)